MERVKRRANARRTSPSARLAEDARKQPKPWPPAAEPCLKRLGIRRESWEDFWSRVEYFVRLENDPPQGNAFLALPVPVPIKNRTASKQARYFARLARRHRKSGDTTRAAHCKEYAKYLGSVGRKAKRHTVEARTWRLLELSQYVHDMTGQWHDREVAGLLLCAGWHPRHRTPLRVLRAQSAPYRAWLRSQELEDAERRLRD
jgi:hypothetical protein